MDELEQETANEESPQEYIYRRKPVPEEVVNEHFPPGMFRGNPRPREDSPEILDAMVREIFPTVKWWMDKQYEDSYGLPLDDEIKSEQHILKALTEACEMEDSYTDGYRMASFLEREYEWPCNFELARILQSTSFYQTHQYALRAWVRDNGFKPLFEVGREVVVYRPDFPDGVKGTISRVEEDGTYCVSLPGLWPVGVPEAKSESFGQIFPWSLVEAWNGNSDQAAAEAKMSLARLTPEQREILKKIAVSNKFTVKYDSEDERYEEFSADDEVLPYGAVVALIKSGLIFGEKVNPAALVELSGPDLFAKEHS